MAERRAGRKLKGFKTFGRWLASRVALLLQFVCVAARESLRDGRTADASKSKVQVGYKKQQLVAPEGPRPGCEAGCSGVAVGVVGGPQLGHPLAKVVHELKHGGGEAGLDEVARQAALTNKHRKEGSEEKSGRVQVVQSQRHSGHPRCQCCFHYYGFNQCWTKVEILTRRSLLCNYWVCLTLNRLCARLFIITIFFLFYEAKLFILIFSKYFRFSSTATVKVFCFVYHFLQNEKSLYSL